MIRNVQHRAIYANANDTRGRANELESGNYKGNRTTMWRNATLTSDMWDICCLPHTKKHNQKKHSTPREEGIITKIHRIHICWVDNSFFSWALKSTFLPKKPPRVLTGYTAHSRQGMYKKRGLFCFSPKTWVRTEESVKERTTTVAMHDTLIPVCHYPGLSHFRPLKNVEATI